MQALIPSNTTGGLLPGDFKSHLSLACFGCVCPSPFRVHLLLRFRRVSMGKLFQGLDPSLSRCL
jgi:hypothetical protein